jgi:hypothetical protein
MRGHYYRALDPELGELETDTGERVRVRVLPDGTLAATLPQVCEDCGQPLATHSDCP